MTNPTCFAGYPPDGSRQAAARAGRATSPLKQGRPRLPAAMGMADIVLLGLATHKLTRLMTKDAVTSVWRSPFTSYQGPSGAGEVQESSRGRGLRRAIGDLLSCPFCAGPWAAGGLTSGWLFLPRFTRILAGLLSAVTISDFPQHAYQKARGWSR